MDESVYIHPLANNHAKSIGPGTRVWAFVTLQEGSVIGKECNLCDHAGLGVDAVIGDRVTIKEYTGIGQGTIIEDDVFIGPGVFTPNDSFPRSPRMKEFPQIAERYKDNANWLKSTRIERGASVGTGVIISPGLTIGRFALIGNGSVVTKDVPAHRLVVGHPARGIAWVCFCGMKLDATEEEGCFVCTPCDYTFKKNEAGGLERTNG